MSSLAFWDMDIYLTCGIVDSSNTDLNSAWMAMGLRSVFDESTITCKYTVKILSFWSKNVRDELQLSKVFIFEYEVTVFPFYCGKVFISA